MAAALPSSDDVRAAHRRIEHAVVRTPLLRHPIEGRDAWFKAECLQRTGSFKLRGATNFISQLDPDVRGEGVVAYSSGNHAQGVAAAAAEFGVSATIVMPSDAPRIKLENTRRWGAEVVEYDRASESREAIAETIAAQRGMALVPPFDSPWTIAGQGTVGMEILEDLAIAGVEGATVVVPASGGGLTAGIALAAEHEGPRLAVLSAEPETHDDHRRSFQAGRPVVLEDPEPSICDALLQRTPGEITFAVNRDRVSGGVVASDMQVRNAMRWAFESLKLVVEPGGAVALAAVLAGVVDVSGPLVVVLSGGNVDPELMADVLA